jgi:hypothetical protein
MHFRSPSSSASALWTALNANVTSGMWTQTSNAIGIGEVDITPLDGTGLTLFQQTGLPAKWKGGVTGGDIIPAMSVILKLTTAFRGRANRGRLFLPWVVEGQQTAGVIDATEVTNQTTAWNTFMAAMASSGHHLCVASYKYALSNDVANLSIESYAGTQRRRQPRPT